MLRNIFSIGVRSLSSHVKSFKIVKSHTKVPQSYQIQPVQTYCSKVEDVFPNETPSIEDPEREKRLKVIKLEMDVCRQEGRRVPDPASIKPQQWEDILALPSRSARWKFYAFLWQIEKRKESEVIKKEKKRLVIEEKRAQEREQNDDGHINYGLHRNTMFLRIYDTTIDRWNNNKLINAMQFGPKLIIDCSYDKHMVPREAKNTAKQLMFLFADNRVDTEPFDLHFCNANFNSIVMKNLQKHIPTMLETGFPINIHEESYLELFPRKKLVYLTPHCNNDLLEYNHDDIYIVGAMVDKINNDPLSLAKAKSQGLRMARLPLDHYLQWGSGSGKSLTIDQMLKILLDVKTSGDWNKALRFVPRRKLADYRQDKEERIPTSYKLERFQDYKFNVEKWGAKKFNSHSEKKVDRRLESKNSTRKVLDNIFVEEKS